MKSLAVVISGLPATKNLREIDIQPGTTAGDVLRALSLTGYLLSREGSAQAFANEEEIYPVVENGSKMRATPIAEVGVGGLLAKLLTWLGLSDLVRSRVRIRSSLRNGKVPQSAMPRVLPGGRVCVAPDCRALWEARGWQKKGKWLMGAFRTPRGSIAGEIATGSSVPEFYIINPPPGLLSGSHGTCFRWRGPGRFFVHFGQASPDIDAGIVAVEKLLVAAL